jgi:hypothetical protein
MRMEVTRMRPRTTSQVKNQAIRQAQTGMTVPFDLGLIRKAPGFEIPDIEGTVEGWRAWVVAKQLPPYGTDPKMHSVVWNYTWYPMQVAEAECGTGGRHNHDGPAADARCSCGFYTAKTLKHLMEMGYHSYGDFDRDTYVKVVGRVANWGQVTEGTQGWRSQYSYPVMLFCPYEAAYLAKPLEKAFGCKVRLLNFLKAPGSIDQLAIIDPDATKALKPMKLERGRIAGRKCRHVSKPFTGFVASEPEADGDGVEWVTVRWDARPDHEVRMRLANIVVQTLDGEW